MAQVADAGAEMGAAGPALCFSASSAQDLSSPLTLGCHVCSHLPSRALPTWVFTQFTAQSPTARPRPVWCLAQSTAPSTGDNKRPSVSEQPASGTCLSPGAGKAQQPGLGAHFSSRLSGGSALLSISGIEDTHSFLPPHPGLELGFHGPSPQKALLTSGR